ncbi:hypothetical protein AB0J03_37450 [Streptomyces microflavus]|uniref:hypothetical protein n=1 Tax=Streptomyces microflavus TaxID=1919 RepID=UPI0033F6CAB2
MLDAVRAMPKADRLDSKTYVTDYHRAVAAYQDQLAEQRKKRGLGKDPERAARRAEQLTVIDEDWTCPWPLNWQRHYRVLGALVDADGTLPDIAPGITFDGTTSAPG